MITALPLGVYTQGRNYTEYFLPPEIWVDWWKQEGPTITAERPAKLEEGKPTTRVIGAGAEARLGVFGGVAGARYSIAFGDLSFQVRISNVRTPPGRCSPAPTCAKRP